MWKVENELKELKNYKEQWIENSLLAELKTSILEYLQCKTSFLQNEVLP